MCDNGEQNQGSCCPPGSLPALKVPEDYKPQGTWDELSDGFKVYTVDKSNAEAKRAIVVISDIFGADTSRHAGVCDTLAENLECVVVMPDLHRGDGLVPDHLGKPEMYEQVKRHPIEDVQRDLDEIYAKLSKEDVTSIGLIGFCWGAWVVFHESTRCADERLRAGANFHPSLGIEQVFGGKVEDLAAGIKLPQLMAPTGDEDKNVKPGGCLPEDKIAFELFEECKHGFMVRGDVKDETTRGHVERGLKVCTEFFRNKL